MTRLAMLTTIDNPHDPFDEYDAWYAFDARHRYFTMDYLARVAVVSEELSEADRTLAIEQAIDEIVEENVNGMYKKVLREVKEVRRQIPLTSDSNEGSLNL